MPPLELILIAALVVISILLGTLVGFASALTTRIRTTNAALRRIEELLISRAGVLTSVHQPETTTPRPTEVSSREVEPTRYRTIRDLKARHENRSTPVGRRSSDVSVPAIEQRLATTAAGRTTATAHAPAPNADEPASSNERSSASAERTQSEDGLTASPATVVESSAHDEQARVPVAQAENEILATSLVRVSPPNPAEDEATSSMSPAPTDESVKKKEREALLAMLSQRRRRRARYGY